MSEQEVMRAAKKPVGTGSAPFVAQLVALAVVALGVLGVQDACARWGLVTQKSWLQAVVDSVDGLRHDEPVVLVVGLLVALLGVVLLPVVVARRPRHSVDLESATGVHLRTRDLGLLLGEAVEGTDAVTDVSVRTKPRTVRVQVTTFAPKDRREEIRAAALARTEPVLAALASPPRVKLTVKNEVP